MIRLREVTEKDGPFLFEVYADTRAEEISTFGWGEAERNVFLKMQYAAQKHSYLHQYPRAVHQIVMYNETPVGRMITDMTEDAYLLVDVSLHSDFQNQGIGTFLIRNLQNSAEREHKKVRLHVLEHSPARQLYDRLGFRLIGESFPYITMEWRHAESSYHIQRSNDK